MVKEYTTHSYHSQRLGSEIMWQVCVKLGLMILSLIIIFITSVSAPLWILCFNYSLAYFRMKTHC